MYNEGVKSSLQELQSELKDLKYSHFDTYSAFLNIIQTPDSNGTYQPTSHN